MNEVRKARYNTAIIRLLPLLDAMHPDARGTIHIHGAACDTETYVEIAQSFDFKFERSETNVDFCRQIEFNTHLLLIIIIDNAICQSMRSSLIRACETLNPIYVLHITTKEGDVPNSDLRYKSFIHQKDVVPGDETVAQVMRKTLDLLKQANESIINRGPIPDYIENC